MKYCPDCKAQQAHDQFYKKPSAKDELDTYCKKHSKIRRNSYNTTPKLRAKYRLERYGLTPHQEAEMLKAQDGRCEGCRQFKDLYPIYTRGVFRCLGCRTCRKTLRLLY